MFITLLCHYVRRFKYMKMFMVANRTSMKPIAFHMEKRVVLNYVSSYEKSNPDESLAIFKLNKNS